MLHLLLTLFAQSAWNPPAHLLPGVTECFRIVDEELFPTYRGALGEFHELARTTTESYYESPASVATISLATDALLAEGLAVWATIKPENQTSINAIKLVTVVKAYAYARREALKPPDDDPPAVDIGFSPSPYPIKWTDEHGTTSAIAAAINARDVHETDDAVIVYANAGRISGFTVGGGGWTPTPTVVPWWSRSKTLVIVGHPDGTTLGGLPRDAKGKAWGSTVELKDDPTHWDGRIHIVDFVVEASGTNCFQIGQYGSSQILYMDDVRLVNCDLVPNADATIRTIRPISANQCDLTVDGVTCDIPNAYEHYGYTRNCRNVTIRNAYVSATGGQVWQDVGRPSEGPFLGRGLITFQGVAHNFHRDPSRAGSGLTFAGGCKDIVVEDSIIWDNPEEDSDRDFGYGLEATWDGGQHYDLPSGRSNGSVTLRDSLFLSLKPNRNPIKFHDCESVTIERCGFYWGGNRFIDIHDNAGEWTIDDCNTPELRAWAEDVLHAAGMETWILDTDPRVRLIDHNQVLKEVDEY